MKARPRVTQGPWTLERPQNKHSPKIQEVAPPHSVEAEQGVLSSILQSPHEAIAECVAKITPDYFYVPRHRTIYQELIDQWDAGEAIDLITFTQVLRDKNLLDSVGGAAFVTHLQTFAASAAMIAYYIDIVRDKYLLRETIAAGTELVRRAHEEQDDPQAVWDEIQSKLALVRSAHGQDGLSQDAAAILSKPIVTPPDVITGVVHRGGKLLLGGASKSYKTWLLIDLAVSVATGSDWLTVGDVNKGRVLYVNLELPEAFCAKRIQAVCDERQVKLEPGTLTVWNLRGRVREWPRLQRQVQSGKFDLIIVDPVYKLLLLGVGIRDENAAGHIASVLDEMEVLAVRSGAAVAFGAHYSKGNQAAKESIDRISGSGVFARDPDSILNFTKHEQNECFTVEMTLRNHPPREPFVVKWEYPLFVTEGTLDPSRLKQAGRKADESKTADAVFKLLTGKMSASKWETAALARGISRATFYRRVRELEDAGKVQLTEDEEWSPIRSSLKISK